MERDWFRSPHWDAAARADFEVRLARARPHNRPQYLRIKGLSVHDAGDIAGARELLARAADHPDAATFGRASARESLADLERRAGRPAAAEQLYRRLLSEDPALTAPSGMAEISLAELLLDSGRAGDRDEALALLEAWIDRDTMRFGSQLFRWHLACIRAAQGIGDREWMRRAARTALELVSRGPQLPRHPDVGLVHADRATLKRLRRLAK